MIKFIVILFIILCISWCIYTTAYYSSEDFKNIKNRVEIYIKDCNRLNKYIVDLKNKYNYNSINVMNKGKSNYINTSEYNYNKRNLENIKNNKYTYDCSNSVCTNSAKNPFKYICKYFGIKIDENTLNYYEQMLNDYCTVLKGKKDIENKEKEIIKSVENDIPYLIRKLEDKNNLLRQLGIKKIDIGNVDFEKYVFRYISDGGRSSSINEIILDIDNLENFIHYLSDNIKFKKSVVGQRALMTRKLREKIKKRDNYTCKCCGISTKEEPHLLLEIDHIIPVSKGGQTIEDNLQTLCWRCNRKKGNKIK